MAETPVCAYGFCGGFAEELTTGQAESSDYLPDGRSALNARLWSRGRSVAFKHGSILT
jgi:hypothetical protein